MSAEWWSDPEDQRIRFSLCGHVVLAQDIPEALNVNGAELYLCPVCQHPHRTARSCLLSVRDGVPQSSVSWGSSSCRLRMQLADRRGGQGNVANVEALLVRMACPKTTRITLPGQTLALKPGLLQRGSPLHAVLRTTTYGCTVASGGIHLRTGLVLLLSGRGAHFHRVSFLGGTIVCCGEACSVTFHDCDFLQAAVYAVHGATVTLRRCSFRHTYNSVVASGAASALHLDACTFEGCHNAFTAERGAALTASRCAVAAQHGAVVRHDGSCAAFERCSFVSAGPGMAVMADAGTVSLRRCSISQDWGVVASRAVTVELHRSHVEALHDAVSCWGGARVLMRETTASVTKIRGAQALESTTAKAALHLRELEDGEGAPRVQAERCTVHSVVIGMVGVEVACGRAALTLSRISSSTKSDGMTVVASGEHARAVLRDCDVRSARGAACIVKNTGSVAGVDRCHCTGGVMAVGVFAGGRAALRGTRLSGCDPEEGETAAMALCVEDGTALLLRCDIRWADVGVHVCGGRAVVRQTEVSHLCSSPDYPAECGRCGDGYVVDGGCVTVEGGAVRACVAGVVFESAAAGASAEFEGVLFEENLAGIHVQEGGPVRASRCEFRLTLREDKEFPGPLYALHGMPTVEPVSAIHVGKESVGASVHQCTFAGYDVDVWSYAAAAVEVTECRLLSGYPGVARLRLHGPATVADCTFECAVHAISIEDAAGGCVVRGCVFQEGVVVAVSVAGSKDVEVASCTIVATANGVAAMKGSAVLVADCDIETQGICASLQESSVLRVQKTTMRGRICATYVGSAQSTRSTRLSLSDCVLEAKKVGIELVHAVEAMIERCTITAGRVGVWVSRGASAQVCDSVITDCICGVEAGADDSGDGDGELSDGAGPGAPAVSSPAAGRRRKHQRDQRVCAGDYACAHVAAAVELWRVELLRCGIGLKVGPAGRVAATDVAAADCSTGFHIVRGGHVNAFEGCSVVGGTGPAVQAWRQLGPEEGFRLEEEGVAGITEGSSVAVDAAIDA